MHSAFRPNAADIMCIVLKSTGNQEGGDPLGRRPDASRGNEVECSAGDERLNRGMQAIEYAFLAQNAAAKQTQVMYYFSVMRLGNNI